MSYPLVTFPWKDRQEVKDVFAGLYSSNVERQKHAIGRVQIWESRALSRLPLAAETTAALVKVNIEYQSSMKPVGNDVRLRELYSMAIIRFVNLFTERNQQKAHALPVHVVASRLGVPAWIVDLRHAATHDALPSLTELRAASNWCLQWLQTEFWEIQTMETGTAVKSKMSNLQTARDLLVTFMQRQFEGLSKGETVTSKILLSKIETIFRDIGEDVCTIILEDGYSVFIDEQLVTLGLDQEDIKDLQTPSLPKKVFEFWKPVLYLLSKCKLLPSYLLHLVTLVGQCSNLRNSFLCKWLYTIIKNAEKMHVNLDIPYNTLLALCLQSKTDDLDASIELLIQKANLQKQAKSTLSHLSLLMNCESIEEDSNEQVYTLENLQQNKTEGSNPWRRCTENIDWARLPLGMLPDQETGFTSLEIGETLPDIASDDGDIQFDQDMESEEEYDIMNNLSETDLSKGALNMLWDNSCLDNIAESTVVF